MGEHVKDPSTLKQTPAPKDYIDKSFDSNHRPSIYLASPFFNQEEVDFVEKVRDKLMGIGFNVYSPKDCGGMFGVDKDKSQAEDVFNTDCNALATCPVMVAIIDDFDPGTIWEIGAGYAASKRIITISRNGYGLNIMLAFSACAHFQDFDEFSEEMTKFYETNIVPIKPWTGDVC
jgi:nucleoside 2-deoxyribosyltransferase